MQKFKIGDWARVSNERIKIGKVIEADEFYYTIENYGQVDLSDVELWQPKEGEWCWFWNYGDSVPILGKLFIIEFSKMPQIVKSSGLVYVVQNRCYGNTHFKYCKPFIGELP